MSSDSKDTAQERSNKTALERSGEPAHSDSNSEPLWEGDQIATVGRTTTVVTSHSPLETFELGVRLGEQASAGAVLLLKGDLGAGKTLLVKGIAAGLGIEPADVTSPTFALVNEHRGRLPLYHVDLYRLDRSHRDQSGRYEGLPELGLEEIVDAGDSVVAIEWAERLGRSPRGAIEIEIVWVSDQEREIRIRR